LFQFSAALHGVADAGNTPPKAKTLKKNNPGWEEDPPAGIGRMKLLASTAGRTQSNMKL
jgi:hypothetical protein